MAGEKRIDHGAVLGDDGFAHCVGKIDDGVALIARGALAPEVFNDRDGVVFLAHDDQIVALAVGLRVLGGFAADVVDEFVANIWLGLNVDARALRKRDDLIHARGLNVGGHSCFTSCDGSTLGSRDRFGSGRRPSACQNWVGVFRGQIRGETAFRPSYWPRRSAPIGLLRSFSFPCRRLAESPARASAPARIRARDPGGKETPPPRANARANRSGGRVG